MLGVVLAVSRAFFVEAGMACEPELALLEAVAHTHRLPRHWRGRAHTREVQGHFEQLFQFMARACFPLPCAHAGVPVLFIWCHMMQKRGCHMRHASGYSAWATSFVLHALHVPPKHAFSRLVQIDNITPFKVC